MYLAVITEEYCYLSAGVGPAGEVQSAASVLGLDPLLLSVRPGWKV